MSSECKYSFLEVKAKLEALCAYQERCSFELKNKMRTWRVSEDDQNALLAHLIEHNFLSEERFAEAFVSGKVKIKKWGKIKIKVELKRRQISDYSIRKAFETIDDELYFRNIESLIESKVKSLKGDPSAYENKVKVYRYLASKGYEQDFVKDVLNQFLRKNKIH